MTSSALMTDVGMKKVRGIRPTLSSRIFFECFFGLLQLTAGTSSKADISSGQESVNERIKRSAHHDEKRLWPNATIPYTFSDAINNDKRVDKAAIMKSMEHYHDRTCIRFVPWSEQEPSSTKYLQFITGNGCSSQVGMSSGTGPQDISINESCSQRDIIHELGHLLGLWHEQSRLDRDAHVIIHWDNIIPNQRYNFDKPSDMQWIGPYDLSSIMHYHVSMYSIKLKRIIEPLKKDLDHIIGNRNDLSFYDAFKLNTLYRCSSHCTDTKPECENGGYLDQFCKCVCPKSLTGSRCQFPENHKTCGGESFVEITRGSKRLLTPPKFRSNYPPNFNCTWLIKAPLRHRIVLYVESFNVDCNGTVELRDHYVGIEEGTRFCGELIHESRTFTSTTNLMIVTIQTGKFGSRPEFKAVVKAIPTEDCASDPCQNGATCQDIPGIETYFCSCLPYWLGQNCDIPIINGTWSEWSKWNGCHAQCGREDRTRTCIEPQNGGSPCSGPNIETRSCGENERECQDMFSCDFGVTSDNGTCHIIQDVQSDQLNWTLHHASTLSELTGPSAGHTTGTAEDVYFYVEASDGSHYDKAIFWLPQLFAVTGRYCLEFFYHMDGLFMGMLSVTRVTRSSRRTIWQKSGSQGDVWHKASINILLHSGVKIEFTGHRGNGALSDIAVDDISISRTGCYINHTGIRMLRLPKHLRSFHACIFGSKFYRVGNFSYIEGCKRKHCYCNQDGKTDCPSWRTQKICSETRQ